MNKTAHKLVSILILLASIFGLLAGAFGVRDALAVKTFLQGDGTGDDPVAMLTDGISQLKENEKAYNDGIIQYKDGLVQLEDGAVQLADGEVQLADGKKQLKDGEAQLARTGLQRLRCRPETAGGRSEADRREHRRVQRG